MAPPSMRISSLLSLSLTDNEEDVHCKYLITHYDDDKDDDDDDGQPQQQQQSEQNTRMGMRSQQSRSLLLLLDDDATSAYQLQGQRHSSSYIHYNQAEVYSTTCILVDMHWSVDDDSSRPRMFN